MKLYKTIVVGAIAGVMTLSLFPQFAFAQAQDGGIASDDPKDEAAFQLVPCSGVKDAKDPNSKECDFNQLINMVNRIIKFLLYLSIPLVLGMIMFTAFLFLTSNGNPAKVTKAKSMFKYVAIGLFWVLGSYIVVYTVLDNLLKDDVAGQSQNILDQYFKK